MATIFRATLYCKQLQVTSRFYQGVFDASVLHEDENHVALQLEGFKLFLEPLPSHLHNLENPAANPVLWFSVQSLDDIRARAEKHAGQVDRKPPAWIVDQQRICEGVDPDGNVFKLFSE